MKHGKLFFIGSFQPNPNEKEIRFSVPSIPEGIVLYTDNENIFNYKTNISTTSTEVVVETVKLKNKILHCNAYYLFGSKNELEKMEEEVRLNRVNYTQNKKPECSHNYVKYFGLRDSYSYCTKCDDKINQ